MSRGAEVEHQGFVASAEYSTSEEESGIHVLGIKEEKVPGGQSWHADEEVEVLYVPMAHCTQVFGLTAPKAVEYVPTPHAVTTGVKSARIEIQPLNATGMIFR